VTFKWNYNLCNYSWSIKIIINIIYIWKQKRNVWSKTSYVDLNYFGDGAYGMVASAYDTVKNEKVALTKSLHSNIRRIVKERWLKSVLTRFKNENSSDNSDIITINSINEM